MAWTKRIAHFLASKTLAAGVLGFLLSLFATEILYIVPKGMELEVTGLLLVPIIILMVHIAGFLDELRNRWWKWRRIIKPIRIGVLSPYFESKKGKKCKLQFAPNSGWVDFLNQKNFEKKQLEVTEIYWSEISSKQAVVVNPFGEIYLEDDKRKLSTYRKIKDFIADGGIFCCTGGFPFYYFWNEIIGKEIDTTPKTRRTAQVGAVEDTRYFIDSLVTKDFGVDINGIPLKPTLTHSYQENADIEYFGNLSTTGGSDLIWEFRSLSQETLSVIPGLRVKHGNEEQYALAAIPYGKGYLVIAGMALKPAEVEFKKLAQGLITFTNEIARRKKTKWQSKCENFKDKLEAFKSEKEVSVADQKTPRIVGRLLLYTVLIFASLEGTRLLFSFITNFVQTHNMFWKFSVTSGLQFDFYGAIIPAITGIAFVLIYFVSFKTASKRFWACFLLVYSSALFFFQPQQRTGGLAIVGVPYYFSFIASLLATFVVFLVIKPSQKIRFKDIKLRVNLRNYAKSLLVAGSFGFLSVLLVDLTCFSIIGNMYVGALGLTDGILLTGIYALLTISFFAGILGLCLETKKLLGIVIRRHMSLN
jgi:hypothetical protein